MSTEGRDKLAARADEWADRQAGAFADHPKRTVFKYVAYAFILVVLVGAVGTGCAYLRGWFDNGRDIVSAQNHKTQSYNVREAWNSMEAELGNACGAVQRAHQDGDPTYVEDPAFAYAATYRKTRSEYNRMQENPYENGVINAAGYPKHVPIFNEEYKATPNWCKVQQQLVEMHQ